MPQQAVAKRLARASAQRLRGEVLAPHGPRERARDQVRVVLGAVADQVAEAVLPRLSHEHYKQNILSGSKDQKFLCEYTNVLWYCWSNAEYIICREEFATSTVSSLCYRRTAVRSTASALAAARPWCRCCAPPRARGTVGPAPSRTPAGKGSIVI